MTATLPAASCHVPVFSLQGGLLLRAVFERAWHLVDAEDRVLTIAALPYNGPMAIRIDRPSIGHLSVRPGMPATIGNGVLRVGPVRIDLRRATIWSPESAPRLPLDRAALTHDLRRLTALVVPSSAAKVSSPWQPQLQKRLALLRDALRHNNAVNTQAAAIALLGLGPGLTPTGDDILCGLLAGLHILSHRITTSEPLSHLTAHGSPLKAHGSQLTTAILDAARTRTTPFSRTLLTWAARGVAAQPLLDVLLSLGSGRLIHGLEALLAIGHTSGRDMLTGAVLAVSAIRQREEMSGSALDRPA